MLLAPPAGLVAGRQVGFCKLRPIATLSAQRNAAKDATSTSARMHQAAI